MSGSENAADWEEREARHATHYRPVDACGAGDDQRWMLSRLHEGAAARGATPTTLHDLVRPPNRRHCPSCCVGRRRGLGQPRLLRGKATGRARLWRMVLRDGEPAGRRRRDDPRRLGHSHLHPVSRRGLQPNRRLSGLARDEASTNCVTGAAAVLPSPAATSGVFTARGRPAHLPGSSPFGASSERLHFGFGSGALSA